MTKEPTQQEAREQAIEKIANLIGSEHYYKDDWERIKTGNQPNVSPKDAQWVYDVAGRIIRILPGLGYSRPVELTLISDAELNKAFDNAFETPIELDHKPTPDEILTLRLRAVAQDQLSHDKETQEGK